MDQRVVRTFGTAVLHRGHTGARCHRCSSAVAKEEEQDEVVPKEWSPEHEQ
jgi:hypothetical protein